MRYDGEEGIATWNQSQVFDTWTFEHSLFSCYLHSPRAPEPKTTAQAWWGVRNCLFSGVTRFINTEIMWPFRYRQERWTATLRTPPYEVHHTVARVIFLQCKSSGNETRLHLLEINNVYTVARAKCLQILKERHMLIESFTQTSFINFISENVSGPRLWRCCQMEIADVRDVSSVC
jgi:hypothetical protein